MGHNRSNLEHLQPNLPLFEPEDSGTSDKTPQGSSAGKELGIEISVTTKPEEIQREWRQFETSQRLGHANSNWALAWYAAHASEVDLSASIVVGRSLGGAICFILPLELAKVGPIKVLRTPGAGHTTYSDGLFNNHVRSLFLDGQGDLFWDTVFDSLPPIDALTLEGFSLQRHGMDHPFAGLAQSAAAHGSMRMSVQSDWPAQYKAIFDSKTRSNDRRVERRLSEQGTFRHHVATGESDRLGLLDIMLQQKADQFALHKINNPYQAPEIAAFYRNLITEDCSLDGTSLYISAMMLEQQPLAVNFGVLQGAELQGLITSMTTGPMRRQAPGRLLMIHTNQYLSDNQIKIHDFGMGEFGYKEDWCDGTIDRQQILVAFTLPGRAYILAERAKQSIKSSLNRHPSLKGILRRLSYRSSKPKK